MIRPPALRSGARIALVAPAGPLAPGAVDRAAARVDGWGWVPVIGEHARGRHGYLSGSDAERAADFEAALLSPDNDAIWCLRGGYGTMRIVDRLTWSALAERPRALVGFSDNTALHLAAQLAGVVSFHGPHPAAEELPPFAVQRLHAVLSGNNVPEPLPFPSDHPQHRGDTVTGGVVEGPLVGGNLSLVAATLGTIYSVRAKGAILFLEEVGEPAYRIDRLLSQLRLAGIFDAVAGVAVGAFSECPDAQDEQTPAAAEVLQDHLQDLGVPVVAGFPFGHIPESWTLPLGIRARLDADAGTLTLLEPAVTT